MAWRKSLNPERDWVKFHCMYKSRTNDINSRKLGHEIASYSSAVAKVTQTSLTHSDSSCFASSSAISESITKTQSAIKRSLSSNDVVYQHARMVDKGHFSGIGWHLSAQRQRAYFHAGAAVSCLIRGLHLENLQSTISQIGVPKSIIFEGWGEIECCIGQADLLFIPNWSLICLR